MRIEIEWFFLNFVDVPVRYKTVMMQTYQLTGFRVYIMPHTAPLLQMRFARLTKIKIAVAVSSEQATSKQQWLSVIVGMDRRAVHHRSLVALSRNAIIIIAASEAAAAETTDGAWTTVLDYTVIATDSLLHG